MWLCDSKWRKNYGIFRFPIKNSIKWHLVWASTSYLNFFQIYLMPRFEAPANTVQMRAAEIDCYFLVSHGGYFNCLKNCLISNCTLCTANVIGQWIHIHGKFKCESNFQHFYSFTFYMSPNVMNSHSCLIHVNSAISHKMTLKLKNLSLKITINREKCHSLI